MPSITKFACDQCYNSQLSTAYDKKAGSNIRERTCRVCKAFEARLARAAKLGDKMTVRIVKAEWDFWKTHGELLKAINAPPAPAPATRDAEVMTCKVCARVQGLDEFQPTPRNQALRFTTCKSCIRDKRNEGKVAAARTADLVSTVLATGSPTPPPPPPVPSKSCKRCEVDKPLTEYSYHPRTKDNIQTICRPCVIAGLALARVAKKKPIDLAAALDAAGVATAPREIPAPVEPPPPPPPPAPPAPVEPPPPAIAHPPAPTIPAPTSDAPSLITALMSAATQLGMTQAELANANALADRLREELRAAQYEVAARDMQVVELEQKLATLAARTDELSSRPSSPAGDADEAPAGRPNLTIVSAATTAATKFVPLVQDVDLHTPAGPPVPAAPKTMARMVLDALPEAFPEWEASLVKNVMPNSDEIPIELRGAFEAMDDDEIVDAIEIPDNLRGLFQGVEAAELPSAWAAYQSVVTGCSRAKERLFVPAASFTPDLAFDRLVRMVGDHLPRAYRPAAWKQIGRIYENPGKIGILMHAANLKGFQDRGPTYKLDSARFRIMYAIVNGTAFIIHLGKRDEVYQHLGMRGVGN